MNLSNLEKLARLAIKGNDVEEESKEMVKSGLLSPAEHRSLSSLSHQIAANLTFNGKGEGTLRMAGPMAFWIM